ncbi:hypothetical protein SAMN05444320_103157 [Streptoalloteichus hindustanus]|uniref:Uncharacterized protein n=1 Tax=Streptoalloteichus hindustanus TaxID=2017 RepID=A0A1M5AK55_STRHI|nr:hypothetical protein SAMN05444320_103157 [Streptoalloteichus hindustanus]
MAATTALRAAAGQNPEPDHGTRNRVAPARPTRRPTRRPGLTRPHRPPPSAARPHPHPAVGRGSGRPGAAHGNLPRRGDPNPSHPARPPLPRPATTVSPAVR